MPKHIEAAQPRRRTNPLLYVPSHPARTLDRDLEAAGIPKHTPKGKVDFHAARTAYINLLLEDDQLSPKDTQELARHSTSRLTLDVYGRADDARMARAIERLDERVRPSAPAADNAIIMQKVAVGAEPRFSVFIRCCLAALSA